VNPTVRAVIALISDELRVFFEMPADRFGIDELDALEVGIRHARSQLLPYCNAENDSRILPEPPCRRNDAGASSAIHAREPRLSLRP